MRSLLPWSRALAALLTLTACSAADLLDATVPASGYRRVVDIAYGVGPRQRLDVYTTRQPDSSRATIVFFYGGAWESGRRQDYRFVAQALSEAGFWVVVPDYRLFPECVSRLSSKMAQPPSAGPNPTSPRTAAIPADCSSPVTRPARISR